MGSRDKRKEMRKYVFEYNSTGKRITWVRKKLDLTLTEVCNATDIPFASYSDREAGVRTTFYEEILVLATYFDEKWQERYGKFNSYPEYDEKEIDEITFTWICVGTDKVKEEHDMLRRMMVDHHIHYESILNQRMIEDRNQLKMEI